MFEALVDELGVALGVVATLCHMHIDVQTQVLCGSKLSELKKLLEIAQMYNGNY